MAYTSCFTEPDGNAGARLKGRRIGRVKDAALVPLVNPSRIDPLPGGRRDPWLTVRYDQVQSVELGRRNPVSDEMLVPITTTSTCCASRAG